MIQLNSLQITQLDNSTIEWNADNSGNIPFAAVFMAESTKDGIVTITNTVTRTRFAVSVSNLTVDGVVHTTALAAVKALNAFIGAFNSSGGSVITPGDTITSIESGVIGDNITITVKTDSNPTGYQTTYTYHGGDTITGVTSSISGSDIVLSVKTDKNPLGFETILTDALKDIVGDLSSLILLPDNKTLRATMSTGTIKEVDLSPIIPISSKSGFAIRWNVSGLNVSINSGSSYNLIQHILSLAPFLTAGITAADFPRVGTGSNAVLKFPSVNKFTAYTIDLRLTGSITSSNQFFPIEIRRPDNSLIKADTFSKTTGSALTSETENIFTYTNGITDPYTVDGMKLLINNVTSSTIILTGFELIISAEIKDY